jgi:outer membrane receptor for monomeric catechols
MLVRKLTTVVVAFVAICSSDGAFAGNGRPHQTHAVSRSNQVTWKKNAVRRRAFAADPFADPAAPYKANRLSSSRQPIINIPSQTTVITRQVMDDKNATTPAEVLRSTPGVTVGR